jgi:hypothetical protein
MLESTMAKIRDCELRVNHCRERLEGLLVPEKRTGFEEKLREEEAAAKALIQFRDEITKYWFNEDQRILGHIAYSPPITYNFGAKGYTEDWALIELDRDKIHWNTFKGNVIDLGTFDLLPKAA